MELSALDEVYEVFAIRYARLERSATHNFLGGDSHDVPMPLDYFVWLIRGHGRCILVDTGFDEAMADKRGRVITREVGDGLRALGVAPVAIETIIITHMHYDHCGNHALFPSARYILQDKEMAYATGRCMCHGAIRSAFDVGDVTAMVEKLFAERVIFHDGMAEIAPGISVHHVGGHTQGLQAVRVRTTRGWVMLASDAAHFYANRERGIPFPIVDSVSSYLEALHTIDSLASSPDHMIPGHDPLVLALYPGVPGVPDVACLHLPPEPMPV